MRCHGITTYFEGSHEPHFYILADDDEALLHALNVIKTSKEIDWFSVDGEDGPEFYDNLFYKIYPGLRTSNQTARNE